MVTIPPDKPCIFLQGKSRYSTIITFDSHEETDTSATFTSHPDNIVVQGITFKVSAVLVLQIGIWLALFLANNSADSRFFPSLFRVRRIRTTGTGAKPTSHP